MVLAMFVDADRVSLLSALAGGSVYVTPSIIDPAETPPFVRQPIAEFAKGIFVAQHNLSNPLLAQRVTRRTAFYQSIGAAWTPVNLDIAELRQARHFASPAARSAARQINPALKIRRVSAGEAEAAAVAVNRGWTLWSDDAAIINLLGALYPGYPVERISGLVIRATHEGLLGCEEAAGLYNEVFKRQLGLWTTRTLVCERGRVSVS
jgi:hypothetical protein